VEIDAGNHAGVSADEAWNTGAGVADDDDASLGLFMIIAVISPFDPYYICDEMVVCCF